MCGLEFTDADPASGKELRLAAPDPGQVPLALRYAAGARTARGR